MRLVLLAASLLTLAACQPAADKPKEPTPEELGQDDPNIPFKPAAVGPSVKYEAVSNTALTITGDLQFTPTPQPSENMTSGADFFFGNGQIYKTRLEPGMATQGTPAFPKWPEIMPGVDPEKIEMYTVEEETIPANATQGGLCEAKTFAIAIGRRRDDKGEIITLIGFTGTQWPPLDPETVKCGTFDFTRPNQ
jgi:hypothetical protein